MAIGSFGRALGQMAKESITGSARGFASGVKGAFLSEMPGVSSVYGFAKDVRSRMADSGANVVAKEQRTGNLISLEMVRQLKQINLNVLRQTMFSAQQQKTERLKGMFAEEVEREKSLRDNALLNAIKSIGKGLNFGGKASTTEGGGGPGLLTSILAGAGLRALLGAALIPVLGALAAGIKTILAAIAALATKIGLQSLGGFGRGAPIPGRGRTARTQPRIPKGQPGAGRFMKTPPASGARLGAGAIRGGFAAAGTALRTNPFTFALGAGLLLPEVLEMMGYDPYGAMANFFFPSAQAAPSTSSTSSTSNSYLSKVIQAESGGRSNAQASTSSAYGLGQFTKGTFESLAANSPRNSVLYGKSFEDYKKSEELQIAALQALTDQNRARLAKSGLPTDDASLYLAHFLGAGMALRVLQANNNTDLKKILPESYFRANPAVFGNLKTVGDLKAWAAAKMSGPVSKRAAAAAGAGGGGRPPRGSVATDPGEIPGVTTFSNASAKVTTPAGSGTALPTMAIPKVHDPIADKHLAKSIKLLTDIRKSSGTVAKETRVVANHYRPTRRVKTPQEKAEEHFQKAQENVLNAVDRTLTKFIGATLTDALIPGGYGRGVTAAQASRTGYIGQTIGQATGIDKKVSGALTKVFGKEYGQMLAPAVSGLGKAYVNKLGIELGTSLFANTMGSNEAAAAITGQIVGNFAKGNKQMAMEQMLYAFTGMPTGPETIAAHYGFSSAAQGIQHIAEYGAATITNSMQDITGMAGRPQNLPNMPTGGYGGLRGPTTLGTGSTANIVPHKTQADVTKYGLVGGPVGDATLKQAETTENLYSLTGTAHKEGISVSRDNTSEIKLNAQQNTQDIVTAIQNQPRGGGGTMIGGGGFMGSFGNFLMDMGTSLVVSKLTSGIKNPYLRSAANFAGMYGMKNYVTPAIARSIGIPGIGGAAGGASTSLAFQGGGIASNLMSGFNTFQTMGPAYMMSNTLSSFMPSMYSIGSTLGGSALGSTFSQFGSGFTYGATPMGQAVGDALGNSFAFQAGSFAAKALPYAGAIMKALQGDIKGAATTAAGVYIGTMIGGPIGGMIGGFIGGLFGGKKKPKPTVARAIYVRGNNDISQKFTVGVRDIKKQDTIDAFAMMLDAYLNIAFNATKTIEAKTKLKPAFYAIVMEYRSGSNLHMKLFLEGEQVQFLVNPKIKFSYGNPSSKDFKAGSVAKQIVSDIEKQFTSKTESESDLAKIQLATKEVTSTSFMDLTGGLSSNLKRLDLDKEIPLSEMEKRYTAAMDQLKAKPMKQDYYSAGDYDEYGPKQFYNPVTGKYETVASPDKTLYIDALGRPVIDVGQKGFTMEDLMAHEQQYGSPVIINNVDQSQNDSSTNVSGNGTMGPPDPDSMAAASAGATP